MCDVWRTTGGKRACVRACVRVCARVCVYVCVYVCVRVCACARTRVYVYVHMYVGVYVYLCWTQDLPNKICELIVYLYKIYMYHICKMPATYQKYNKISTSESHSGRHLNILVLIKNYDL